MSTFSFREEEPHAILLGSAFEQAEGDPAPECLPSFVRLFLSSLGSLRPGLVQGLVP